jgi:hypothetical protein
MSSAAAALSSRCPLMTGLKPPRKVCRRRL